MWRELSEAEWQRHPLNHLDRLHKIAFVLFGVWIILTWVPPLIGLVSSLLQGQPNWTLIPGVSHVRIIFSGDPEHPLAVYRLLHLSIDAARWLPLFTVSPILLFLIVIGSPLALSVAKWMIVWILALTFGAALVEWHYWYSSGKWQAIGLMKKHQSQLKRILPEAIIGVLLLRHIAGDPRLNVIFARRERLLPQTS